MENKKMFRVSVIADMAEREMRMLATAARLTAARARSYVFETTTRSAADIYLVDGESPMALRSWHSARARNPAPAIFLVTETNSLSGRREFKRPLVPPSLLGLVNLLDEVTVHEFQFLPELSIGHEGASPDAAVTVASKGTRFSALVVDDSTTVQAQVGLGLKMYGVAADFADTAEKALALIEKNTYDIAFLDVVLPGGADGYQICKAIKKDRKLRHTAVIMLTGKSSTFDRVRASLAGCDAFLTKPVQNEVFQQTLSKYLDERGDERMGQPVIAK